VQTHLVELIAGEWSPLPFPLCRLLVNSRTRSRNFFVAFGLGAKVLKRGLVIFPANELPIASDFNAFQAKCFGQTYNKIFILSCIRDKDHRGVGLGFNG
jgi:hypothetical protein